MQAIAEGQDAAESSAAAADERGRALDAQVSSSNFKRTMNLACKARPCSARAYRPLDENIVHSFGRPPT